MIWELIGQNEDGINIYGRVDEDGLIRITAIPGYKELDEYLQSLEEDNG